MKKINSIVNFLCILSLLSNVCYSMELGPQSPLAGTYLKNVPREIFYELMNFVTAAPYSTALFSKDRLRMLSNIWYPEEKQYNKEVLAARAYFEEIVKALRTFRAYP